jgi:hypothetical protein
MNSANETQVGGDHYKIGYEHWDFTIEALENRYLEGSITKYVSRHRKKNGVQDLKKAQHFVKKLTESYARGIVKPIAISAPAKISKIMRFSNDAKLTLNEHDVITICASWANVADLNRIGKLIAILIEQAERRERLVDAKKAGA